MIATGNQTGLNEIMLAPKLSNVSLFPLISTMEQTSSPKKGASLHAPCQLFCFCSTLKNICV